ncbi:hypothetical protein BJY52DRAFT_1231752 [Lactarius psammicola]|nr:hypothetical protein BJY52DRAFT_1232414 [Lactarius psammicola]KAI9432812.1 hypothetical protein BJY52DRAFT_1231752 [Lactarius psammicola]
MAIGVRNVKQARGPLSDVGWRPPEERVFPQQAVLMKPTLGGLRTNTQQRGRSSTEIVRYQKLMKAGCDSRQAWPTNVPRRSDWVKTGGGGVGIEGDGPTPIHEDRCGEMWPLPSSRPEVRSGGDAMCSDPKEWKFLRPNVKDNTARVVDDREDLMVEKRLEWEPRHQYQRRPQGPRQTSARAPEPTREMVVVRGQEGMGENWVPGGMKIISTQFGIDQIVTLKACDTLGQLLWLRQYPSLTNHFAFDPGEPDHGPGWSWFRP